MRSGHLKTRLCTTIMVVGAMCIQEPAIQFTGKWHGCAFERLPGVGPGQYPQPATLGVHACLDWASPHPPSPSPHSHVHTCMRVLIVSKGCEQKAAKTPPVTPPMMVALPGETPRASSSARMMGNRPR